MEEKDANAILEKIHRGTSSKEEMFLFDQWYFQYQHQHVREYSETELKAIQEEMRRKLPVQQSVFGTRITAESRVSRWQLIAASVLLLSGFTYYFLKSKPMELIPETKYSNDVAPGDNKAYLTLANGQRISLSDAKNGELAQEAGVKITKQVNGEVFYQITDQVGKTANADLLYNTIETPRGGQYQIILPDGTKVWLNAASTLKFPSSFARLVNRRVELLGGEAYFEVAKDPKHPFILKTQQQEVRVLGTHFNINAYPDELAVKTTLLEGKVQLNSDHSSTRFVLEPGQQAALANNGLTVKQVNAEEEIAWKNGYFQFNGENIEEVMRTIARWYNVEVKYKGDRPADQFNGRVSQHRNLSAVLEMLEYTGSVHFKIEGKEVTVMK
ncbi:DUF4974 domain-containing protein [Pedobacter sp. PLR]|uniref:FecR family protein n=1 Tax=Pedobacter sp. PLR TaxID=2994465 RepID=UPI002245CF06|nr:FecR domain-containing protein [Pedobacter sp. PLR]MCX2450325.1 DUF4974 domain-containing protein [Pedobacter sp. PLR]